MALSGKVIIITGASRGIGEAIALSAARDGAKISLFAKTSTPHHKLPGTVHSVAKASGSALPLSVDIRYEDQVEDAVQKTVKEFGKIDILINNASAINLNNTVSTTMKSYDLMNSINARGTFLCSKYCIPYLEKSEHAHILNISPPLNLKPKWFSKHTAYTMAKYGMSMCVLGMSEELRSKNIAVNALWPRTLIYTAATKMLMGDSAISSCRDPKIMSDAAHIILSKSPKDPNNSGNFFLDDEVLKNAGIYDLSKYNLVKNPDLALDFFLDSDEPHNERKNLKSKKKSLSLMDFVQEFQTFLNPRLVKDFDTIVAFKFTDIPKPQYWVLDLKHGSGSLKPLEHVEVGKDVETIYTLSTETFLKLLQKDGDLFYTYINEDISIDGDHASIFYINNLFKAILSHRKRV